MKGPAYKFERLVREKFNYDELRKADVGDLVFLSVPVLETENDHLDYIYRFRVTKCIEHPPDDEVPIIETELEYMDYTSEHFWDIPT